MKAGRKNTSNKKDWNTPIKYVEAAILFFKSIGYEIELDPATNQNSLIPAKVKYILPENDGLLEDWNKKTIWINPPFGRDIERGTTIKDWVSKASFSNKKYGSEILMLIPSSLNTSHYQEIIFKMNYGGVVFLNDTRLRFLDSNNNNNEDKKGSPIGMSIVYFGKFYREFEKTFNFYGKCFEIKNL